MKAQSSPKYRFVAKSSHIEVDELVFDEKRLMTLAKMVKYAQDRFVKNERILSRDRIHFAETGARPDFILSVQIHHL